MAPTLCPITVCLILITLTLLSSIGGMAQDTVERIEKLSTVLKDLNSWQLELVEQVVEQFRKPYISIDGFAESDIVSECFLNYFGDILKIHHTFSKEAFTKDKFEYALERVSNLCGNFAQLAPRGNPGHDITKFITFIFFLV